jgi:hypothetical protein
MEYLSEPSKSDKVKLHLVHEEEESETMSTLVAEPDKALAPATESREPAERPPDRDTSRYERANPGPVRSYPLERTVIRTQRQPAGD